MDALQLLGGNRNDLIRGFAALLTAIEQANLLMSGGAGAASGGAGGSVQASVPNPLTDIRDTFTQYEEKTLPDGNKVRRYDTGAVRILNMRSGVVQEERPNGNLLVSLPTGRVLFQEQPGYPLLVFNSILGGAPLLARVCIVQLGTESEARPAFQFEDEEGNHFIDLESLRYVKVQHGVQQPLGDTAVSHNRMAQVAA
jgi:hypothetical protein